MTGERDSESARPGVSSNEEGAEESDAPVRPGW